MHVTVCTEAQRKNLTLRAVLDWLKAQKKTDLKALLADHASSKEGWLMKSAELHDSSGSPIPALDAYSETEDLLLFVVPKTHCVAALNRCHRDANHQGHDSTLSLLWEHFWWLGMANQMQQSIMSCTHCLHHEGNLSKAPLHLILATASMDLLHVDVTSIEMTLELNRLPKVTNILVFEDHFTKHVMVYVTPDQTPKTVTKFLY